MRLTSCIVNTISAPMTAPGASSRYAETAMISLPIAATLAVAVVSTSFISGIFGMAGGMILLGILLAIMPLAAAMVLHGLTQMASNGWRAWLWMTHIKWPVVACYAAGAAVGGLTLTAAQITPGK